MKTIAAVPESLTREQYTRLVESVGFDTNCLRKLEFRVDGIYAEVMERDEDGRVRIDGDDMVVNRVFIPVRGEETHAPRPE